MNSICFENWLFFRISGHCLDFTRNWLVLLVRPANVCFNSNSPRSYLVLAFCTRIRIGLCHYFFEIAHEERSIFALFQDCCCRNRQTALMELMPVVVCSQMMLYVHVWACTVDTLQADLYLQFTIEDGVLVSKLLSYSNSIQMNSSIGTGKPRPSIGVWRCLEADWHLSLTKFWNHFSSGNCLHHSTLVWLSSRRRAEEAEQGESEACSMEQTAWQQVSDCFRALATDSGWVPHEWVDTLAILYQNQSQDFY